MSQEQTMNHDTKHNLWLRGLHMLLMGLAYQVTGTLLLAVTLIQFVMMLLNDTPKARLLAFGRSLGRYLHQIACFLTFASEDKPFPFSDWPSGE